MASQTEIAQRVVESILAQKLAPGERLGEQELADLFGVSRTLVREALMQLQARGFVEVRTRKGWYVVEPSVEQARDAFAARRAVEAGLLRQADGQLDGKPLQSVVRRLRQHIAEEQRGHRRRRPGHARLPAGRLPRLPGRVPGPPAAVRHAARPDRAHHAGRVALPVDPRRAPVLRRPRADRRGDRTAAQLGARPTLMLDHIGNVEDALGQSAAESADARERLRATLAPLRVGR